MRAFFGLLLISFSAFATIFGNDDRIESRSPEVPAYLQELSKSVPAIIENTRLIQKGDLFVFDGHPLSTVGFCPEARFSSQNYVARCSSSLIGPDLILTAGHCIDDDVKKWCSNYSIVFDYAVDANEKSVHKKDVYKCTEVTYRKFVGAFDEDLAIIKLDRKVDRLPITIAKFLPEVGERLSMIGFPLGIPQKVVDDGNLTQFGPSKFSFKHNLDTFSSNSGGPLFNLKGEQVGVLVRGTGPDYGPVDGKRCYDWGIDSGKGYGEANTLLHLFTP